MPHERQQNTLFNWPNVRKNAGKFVHLSWTRTASAIFKGMRKKDCDARRVRRRWRKLPSRYRWIIRFQNNRWPRLLHANHNLSCKYNLTHHKRTCDKTFPKNIYSRNPYRFIDIPESFNPSRFYPPSPSPFPLSTYLNLRLFNLFLK